MRTLIRGTCSCCGTYALLRETEFLDINACAVCFHLPADAFDGEADDEMVVRLLNKDGQVRTFEAIVVEIIQRAVAFYGPRGKRKAAQQLQIGRSTVYRHLDDTAQVSP